jgi:drug/metabolite transporter (DMT)-like permease
LWRHRQQVIGPLTTAVPSSQDSEPHLSLHRLTAIAHMGKPFSPVATGLLLAAIAGIIENAALLTFSFDTRVATTGITSAIASSYALVVMVFGIVVCNERLARNQLMGIGIFMVGLILLAL